MSCIKWTHTPHDFRIRTKVMANILLPDRFRPVEPPRHTHVNDARHRWKNRLRRFRTDTIRVACEHTSLPVSHIIQRNSILI